MIGTDDEASVSTEPKQGRLLFNEPLAAYTTWRVGGPAKQLYRPSDIYDLRDFLQKQPSDERIVFLGLGSNSLIRDGGFSGTLILTQGALMGVTATDTQQVRVEAGVSCATMARFCARNHLSGVEFLAGIPGTIGGALRMNAGCFGGETWQWVTEVEMISKQGELLRYQPSDFEIAYRQVLGPQDAYFVAATFGLQVGDKQRSLEKIKELLAHRANTQPTNEYNCGSVFRNPPGNYAARLIENLGLKGYRLGGAQVSTKHANFIINYEGEACAKDIEMLIHQVQATVLEKTGIALQREVHIIGEE
jgi:UDP-N-acetylmuramate dehydrogenase